MINIKPPKNCTHICDECDGQGVTEKVYTQKLLRKAKYLDLLKEVLRRAEKGHKECPDFCISCANCQHTMFLGGLHEVISFEKWLAADKKKK